MSFNLQSYLADLSRPADPYAMPFSPVEDPGARNYLVQTQGSVPALQTIGGYQPWGSNLPAGAGFGTKLGSWFSSNGKMIGGVANLASQGINAYLGLQQLGMAKDALAFEKKSFKTNLANSVQSYNTQMQDRINGRFYATEEERQAALKAAELPPGMRG